MTDYTNVDLSDEHINLIVKCIKDKLINTKNEDNVMELENIVFALGKGDELGD